MSQSDARKAFERWDITAMHSILPKEDRWQAWQAARAEALREATSKIDNKAVATGTSTPAEQQLRELVGELQDLARDTEKSASGYGTFSSARAHLMDCKECLDALVKKYGERR